MAGKEVVYLIHFLSPYKHAKHYRGTTNNLKKRLREHSTGVKTKSSALMAAVHAAGIEWVVACTWEGSYALEKKKQARGGASRLCPICKGEK